MDDRQTTWKRIERAELEHTGVSAGAGFGRSEGLRMGGKIYAIDKDDELILKLPAERVEELIGTGAGHAWGPAPDRIMREWIAIPGTRRADWAALTSEARAFVAQANESGPEPQPRDVARAESIEQPRVRERTSLYILDVMKIVKVRRVGNSNVVSIPREYEANGYTPGTSVLVEELPGGELRLLPTDKLREHIAQIGRRVVADHPEALRILAEHDPDR